jgi:DNA-binding CsgD family transcriptional regulator
VLSAAAYYESTGRLPERAWALEDAAVLLAERGDLAAARQALTAAAGLFRGLGAAWNLRRARDRVRGYGIRLDPAGRGPRPATGWQALTATEANVARLVGEGRSNPDIAAELFLSPNTVQTHVSHILAKLGTHSRGEIRQILECAAPANSAGQRSLNREPVEATARP